MGGRPTERAWPRLPKRRCGVVGGDMRRLLVVGTGQMGPGIALSAARGGCQVTLYARSADSLARGMANWRASLADLRRYDIVDADEAASAAAAIVGTTDLERGRAGRRVGDRVDRRGSARQTGALSTAGQPLPTETILTSNTSGLRATDIGAATTPPDAGADDPLLEPTGADGAGGGRARRGERPGHRPARIGPSIVGATRWRCWCGRTCSASSATACSMPCCASAAICSIQAPPMPRRSISC